MRARAMEVLLDGDVPCLLPDAHVRRTPVMGYVRSLRRIGDSFSELDLLMADRSTATVRVPCTSDAGAVTAEVPPSHRPLAVRIELGAEARCEETVTCSCLATTPGGPERLTLSPAAALALFEQGRHTVLVLGADRRH